MTNGNVPIISISLTKEEYALFEKLCKEGTRGPSAQVRHMMKLFVEHKDKK